MEWKFYLTAALDFGECADSRLDYGRLD